MLSEGGGFQQPLECAQIELNAALLTSVDAAYTSDLFGRNKGVVPQQNPCRVCASEAFPTSMSSQYGTLVND